MVTEIEDMGRGVTGVLLGKAPRAGGARVSSPWEEILRKSEEESRKGQGRVTKSTVFGAG